MSASRLELRPSQLSLASGNRFGIARLVGWIGGCRCLPILAMAVWAGSVKAVEPTVAVTQDQAHQWVVALGAPTFAERERAMGEILRAGTPMVPHLRQAVREFRDPELVQRAEFALSKLTVDDLESRIATFLDGTAESGLLARQWFSGWEQFALMVGDSIPLRELFVKVMKSHPRITQSLAEGTVERSLAAQEAVVTIETAIRKKNLPPTVADGVALLLPLTDQAVTAGVRYEEIILGVFNRLYGTVSRDSQLWGPVSRLLEQWMQRSRPENRAAALWSTMQWSLPGGAKLGLQTLEEMKDVETVQTALQSIARFGVPRDAAKLAPLLQDNRPAATSIPTDVQDRRLRVTIADVALATIAILHGVSPKDLGMQAAELHPLVGFSVDHVGFTADQQAERAEAMRLATAWCAGEKPKVTRAATGAKAVTELPPEIPKPDEPGAPAEPLKP